MFVWVWAYIFSDRTLVTKRSFQGGKKAKEIACLRLLLFLINRSHYFVLSICHLSQRHSSTLQLRTAETQVATGCSIIFLEEGTVKETQGKPYPHNLYSRLSSSLAFFGICYPLRDMLSSSPPRCCFQITDSLRGMITLTFQRCSSDLRNTVSPFHFGFPLRMGR